MLKNDQLDEAHERIANQKAQLDRERAGVEEKRLEEARWLVHALEAPIISESRLHCHHSPAPRRGRPTRAS